MGKFVSESFREVHNKTWTAEHKTPGSGDILALLRTKYNNTARWNKALIHLRERGLITGSPKDIGLLIKEVPEDILKEEIDAIKEELFSWAWPQLRRMVTGGLAEWYKEELLKGAFNDTTNH
jgi:hypothetical protein